MAKQLDFHQIALEIALKKGLLTNREKASRKYSDWDVWGRNYILKNPFGDVIGRIKKVDMYSNVGSQSQIYKQKNNDIINDERDNYEAINRKKNDKNIAFRRRLKDTGWGYALASYLIPFIGIYYAISRRTITPFLYVLIGEIIFYIVLFLLGNIATAISQGLGLFIFGLGYISSFALGIYLVKLGINQSRLYAKSKLKEIGNSSERNKIDKKVVGMIDLIEDKNAEENAEEDYIPIGERFNIFMDSIPQRAKRTVEFIKETVPKTIQLTSRNGKDDIDKVKVSLEKLKFMYDQKLINEEEYEAMRKKYLGL